ncbi:MAG: FtsX-like permease family protein [Thermoprotei archaeon]
MRSDIKILLVLGLMLVVFTSLAVPSNGEARQEVVVVVMNYQDKVPVPGLPLRFSVPSPIPVVYSGKTSFNGSVTVSVPFSGGIEQVADVSIGDNYTLVLAGSTPVVSYNLPYGALSTSVSYTGYYEDGFSTYRQSFQPSLAELNGHVVQELILWVLPGKAVRVNTYDLLSGQFDQVVLAPGLPVDGGQYFFVPIDFPISVTAVTPQGVLSPAFEVSVAPTQQSINWSVLYFSGYVNDTISRLSQELAYYRSAGFVLPSEQAYAAVIPLYEGALNNLKAGNYTMASEYFSQAQAVAGSLREAFSSLFEYAWVVTLITLVLIYAVSLVASGAFGDKMGKKLSKFAPLFVFLPLALALAYTQPYAEAALASLFGLRMPLPAVQVALMALSVFSLIYVGLSLLRKAIAVRTSTFISRMALQNFKKEVWRAALVILPIAIVVGSSMSIVNVSFQYGLAETSQGTCACHVPVLSIDIPKNLDLNDFGWLTSQPWVNTSTSVWYYPSTVFLNGTAFSLVSVQLVTPAGTSYLSNAYYAPREALSMFGINKSAIVGSLPVPGEPQVLLPAGLPGVSIGTPVRLVLVLSVSGAGGSSVVDYTLGTYSVSGFYESSGVSRSDFTGSFSGSALLPEMLPGMRPKYMLLTVKSGYDPILLAKQVATITGAPVVGAESGKWYQYAMTYLLGVTHAGDALGPVLISAFLAYSFTLVFIEERRRDTKLMATLGATPKELAGMVVMEIVILGIIATASGVFGSYLMNLLELVFVGASSVEQAWSLNALLMGVLIGLVIPLVGAFVAVNRFGETKVVGGPKKRVIPNEARMEGGQSAYQLPIKIGEDEAELFLRYLKERVVPSLKGLNPELNASETGQFSLKVDAKWRMAVGSPESMVIRSSSSGGLMSFEISYPPILSSDHEFQEFLYGLERSFLEYPIWRDRTVKVSVSRRAVPRVSEKVQAKEHEKGLDELVADIEAIRKLVDQYNTKLEQLNSMRGEVSQPMFTEFEKKYKNGLKEALNQLKPLAAKAEQYREPLKKELSNYIKALANLEASKKLGDMSDEEYSARKATYESELQLARSRLSTIEWALSQLSAPERFFR